MRSFPWATAAIAIVAVLACGVPSFADALIYDRAAVLRGQVWRLWTGHGVHFSLAHLLWNLALFGFVGSWLERVAPAATRWFYLVMPALIAGLLLVLDPSLSRYAGLSGLGAGLTVLLALRQWRLPTESRIIWTAVLGLVALKVAIEWVTGVPLLTEGIRSVPLAHAAGILGAVAWFALERRADRRV
jgi:rhomboid family GlyGly-CTERM serine protease